MSTLLLYAALAALGFAALVLIDVHGSHGGRRCVVAALLGQ
jgi:hypothetical protein